MTIQKSSSFTLILHYGDAIYDKPFNITFQNKLEAFQTWLLQVQLAGRSENEFINNLI